MATGLLERTRENSPELKAYGKLQGGVQEEEMSEEQRALQFNSRISSNYQRLMNPDYKRAEDFMENAPASDASAFETPAERAQATLYPERYAETFEARRAAAPYAEAPVADFVQAPYAEPAVQPEQYAEPYTAQPQQEYYGQPAYAAEEAEADLMPTQTTIQYRDGLFREERREVTEEKRKSTMTARGKMLMVVYAVAVVIILALIIINTSALRRADSEIASREAELSSIAAQAQELQGEIDYLTDPETILQRAAEELNMTTRGN